MDSLIIKTSAVTETQALARQISGLLKGGEILFFEGPIGAGKTVMVKEIVKNFGFKKLPVSASFSLLKKYQNENVTLYHADLFRLKEGEMFNLGFEEMLEDENAILLIEWAEAARNFFPQTRLEITVTLLEGDRREISLKALGKTAQNIVEVLSKKYAKK
ncbi:MAG: tRNA (adenosine(37)-N6)-threonylcarbamoyltransferase complex ATPase subunit type 1 TsaE [Elusimicrobiaceae bacterium]|nr:tRNA (adenosine(37)-N6)-threonylcarbamoyltransferase complex ATPase subunit type 1 TsaE [Elusimicrobiaceae bacterium]